MFHDVVAQYRLGKGEFCTLNCGSIQLFPEPYVPAGRPVRIELKTDVSLYFLEFSRFNKEHT
jgi:hypothetical protein